MASKTYTYAYVGKNAVEEQMIILERLKDNANAWACITHDKDDTETHTHFLFTSYKTIKTLAKAVECESLHLEQIDNANAYAQYMLHQTEKSKEDGKAEYDVKLMQFSSLKYKATLGFAEVVVKVNEDEENQAKTLYNLAIDFDTKNIAQFIKKGIQSGCYSELRRGFSMWKTLFDYANLSRSGFDSEEFNLSVLKCMLDIVEYRAKSFDPNTSEYDIISHYRNNVYTQALENLEQNPFVSKATLLCNIAEQTEKINNIKYNYNLKMEN